MCIADFKSFSLELVCSTKLVTELGHERAIKSSNEVPFPLPRSRNNLIFNLLWGYLFKSNSPGD
jgi:hypothetical protein